MNRRLPQPSEQAGGPCWLGPGGGGAERMGVDASTESREEVGEYPGGGAGVGERVVGAVEGYLVALAQVAETVAQGAIGVE